MVENTSVDEKYMEGIKLLQEIRSTVDSVSHDCLMQIDSIKLMPANETFSLRPMNVLRGIVNVAYDLVRTIVRVDKIFKDFKTGELEKFYHENIASVGSIHGKSDSFFKADRIEVPVGFTTDGTTLFDAVSKLDDELKMIGIYYKTESLKSLINTLDKALSKRNQLPVINITDTPNDKKYQMILKMMEDPRGYKNGCAFSDVIRSASELPKLCDTIIKCSTKHYNDATKSSKQMREVETVLKNLIPKVAKSEYVDPSQVETLVGLIRSHATFATHTAHYVMFLHKIEHNMTLNYRRWKERL